MYAEVHEPMLPQFLVVMDHNELLPSVCRVAGVIWPLHQVIFWIYPILTPLEIAVTHRRVVTRLATLSCWFQRSPRRRRVSYDVYGKSWACDALIWAACVYYRPGTVGVKVSTRSRHAKRPLFASTSSPLTSQTAAPRRNTILEVLEWFGMPSTASRVHLYSHCMRCEVRQMTEFGQFERRTLLMDLLESNHGVYP